MHILEEISFPDELTESVVENNFRNLLKLQDFDKFLEIANRHAMENPISDSVLIARIGPNYSVYNSVHITSKSVGNEGSRIFFDYSHESGRIFEEIYESKPFPDISRYKNQNEHVSVDEITYIFYFRINGVLEVLYFSESNIPIELRSFTDFPKIVY